MNTYETYREKTGEYGIVSQVQHPVVVVEGLPGAKPNEIVVFDTGEMGEIFTVEKDAVEILVFSQTPIRVGTEVTRTDKSFSVPVGREMLGQIVDPLGKSISNISTYKPPVQEQIVDQEVQSIATRSRITKPLVTGVTVVDITVPLGMGQRELIIGDRKTGKTAFLMTTLKNQAATGTIIIYAAIAQKKSDIKKLKEFFEKENIMKNSVIVATSSYDSPSLIYLTPYAAITIAEYFRDLGQDTLVVLDDLSGHARFYREIALLSKRFPGRDSYPGDIFYAHAKIMERAGNFKGKNGAVSITCLPVVETVEGDLTSYIATNLMGMTDGHIFFDSNAFYKGRRPAVNIFLSVTRVGRQTQTPLGRDINRKLTAFLASYEKMQDFSHFGAELSEHIKSVLRTGDKLYRFFDQYYSLIVPLPVQLILLALIWSKAFDTEPNEKIDEVKQKLITAWESSETRKFLEETVKANNLYDLLSSVTKNKEKILTL